MSDGYKRVFGNTMGEVTDDAWIATSVEAEENRKPKLGEIRWDTEGNAYIVCSTEADLVAGEMVGMAEASVTELANSCTAAAIGATAITIDTTGTAYFGGSAGVVAANRFAEGKLLMVDGTGEGYEYRILSNTAGTASVSVVFTIEDPGLKVAIDATTDIMLVGPSYRYVLEGTADLRPLGSAMVPTTGATNSREEFFWVKFRGIKACLGAATAGDPVATAASGAVADSAEAGSGAYDNIIGYAVGTTSDGYAVVRLDVPGMPIANS